MATEEKMKRCTARIWFKYDPPPYAEMKLKLEDVLITLAKIKERHIREMLSHWVSEEEPQVMEQIMPNGGFHILGLGRVGCDDIIIDMPFVCNLEL